MFIKIFTPNENGKIELTIKELEALIQEAVDKAYCEHVDARVINIMKDKVAEYNKLQDTFYTLPEGVSDKLRKDYQDLIKKKYLEILYTNPAGFELTARLTTNYRCLLNIYIQRHDHRLPEWREFCEKLLELPMFPELIAAYKSGKVEI